MRVFLFLLIFGITATWAQNLGAVVGMRGAPTRADLVAEASSSWEPRLQVFVAQPPFYELQLGPVWSGVVLDTLSGDLSGGEITLQRRGWFSRFRLGMPIGEGLRAFASVSHSRIRIRSNVKADVKFREWGGGWGWGWAMGQRLECVAEGGWLVVPEYDDWLAGRRRGWSGPYFEVALQGAVF